MNFHSTPNRKNDVDINHKESIGDYDVAIVGAGPSGLSAAIHLKNLASQNGKDIKICVFEKAPEVGAHILSGAVMEPRSLSELIPEWKELGAPLNVQAKEDKFIFMTEKGHYRLPTPPQMHNEGNYIVSLSNVVRWLGEQAEALGIEIYPDCPISEVLYDEKGNVKGVGTAPKGLDKEGKPKDTFQNGFTVNSRLTLLAEGCRGSVTKTLFEKFNLRENCEPQVYGLGVKELWEIDPSKHQEGSIIHTVGWPLDQATYGGSWMYHLDSNMVSLGFVVGLGYENPTLSPYKTLQQFKHHPYIRNFLEGGKCIGYGARTISAGGLQSIPKLAFPGGALIGDCAGFLNLPKIKGTHTAMKSGIIVAEAAAEKLFNSEGSDAPVYLDNYYDKFRSSWLHSELSSVRNIKPGFRYGLYGGIINGAIETYVFRGHSPWTLKHEKADHQKTKPIKDVKKIEYPKPDGKISFDLLTNLVRSNTNHPEDIPIHLKVKNEETTFNELNVYGGPSNYYCPAGVYEWIDGEDGKKKFQINSQNCIHCKTCDIKDPNQNINWTVPEGGGPLYSGL